MNTKILKIIIIMVIFVAGLLAGRGIHLIDVLKQLPHIQAVNVVTGCRMDYEPGLELWRVYDPADAIVFEGGETAGVFFLLNDCQ